MKYLTLIAVMFAFVLGDRSEAQSVLLKVGDYALAGSPAPKKEGITVPFLQASFSKSAKNPKAFGLWYSATEKGMSDVVLEIADASTKNVIQSITAAEFAGKSKTESMNNGSHVVSTYQFGSGAGTIEVQVDCDAVADESAPLGRKLIISYKLRTAKATVVNAVLRLKSDGDIQKIGGNGIAVTRIENDQSGFPSIVLSSPTPVNTEVGARANGLQEVSIQSLNVPVKEKAWTSIISFEAVGTTVKDAGKTLDQASRIVNRVTSKEAKPELVIFNTANPTATVPGDTVTYVITYCNIGNALAKNAEFSNPVPEGVRLLENTVENAGAEVVIERKPATAPEAGVPTLVRWKLKKSILPGEEGKLTMKVVVR